MRELGHMSMASEVQANVGRFQVTPENVLALHNALAAEAKLIHGKIAVASYSAHVGKPGADEVSTTAAEGFNAKIDSLVKQCVAYADALQASADNLARIAKNYGHTEAEINASFATFNTGYQARHANSAS